MSVLEHAIINFEETVYLLGIAMFSDRQQRWHSRCKIDLRKAKGCWLRAPTRKSNVRIRAVRR